MSNSSLTTDQPIFLLSAAFVVLATGLYWLRYTQAKTAAEEWLREHHYRVARLSVPWFRGVFFSPAPLRNSRNAFAFEAVVADTDLGGTGIVFLRVWTTLLGVSNRDVEVVWKRMPQGGIGETQPLAERLADEQLALLRRIAAGESRFYAPRRWETGGAEYDEMVEHMLALSRRGMISCSEPAAGVKGVTQYSDLANIALTPAGREFLDSRLAQARRML